MYRRFTVTLPRVGVFPLSMLRFDEAFPATDEDANMIERLIRQDDIEGLPPRVTVSLASYARHAPSKRWDSFNVQVNAET